MLKCEIYNAVIQGVTKINQNILPQSCNFLHSDVRVGQGHQVGRWFFFGSLFIPNFGM